VARSSGKGGKKPVVNCSVGVFVPKPHTPFQWEAQIDADEAWRRLDLIKSSLGDRRIKLKWNAPDSSVLEGILSRGDRRLGRAIELAVEAGCSFDGWGEELNLSAWLEALEQAGLRVEDYLRARDLDEVLPWDHIDLGLSKAFFKHERQRALEEPGNRGLPGRGLPGLRGLRLQGNYAPHRQKGRTAGGTRRPVP
jgi:hypothetical protein